MLTNSIYLSGLKLKHNQKSITIYKKEAKQKHIKKQYEIYQHIKYQRVHAHEQHK